MLTFWAQAPSAGVLCGWGPGTPALPATWGLAGEIRSTTNIVVPSTGKICLSGAGGARYIADNPTQQAIEVMGKLIAGGGFGSTGVTLNTDGTIQTNGNVQILRSDIPTQPTLLPLGREDIQGGVPAYTN